MSQADRAAREATPDTRTLLPLLDAVFGFFIWLAHLLVIYIAAALFCGLGFGATGAGTRTTFVAVLALVTVAAAAVVLLHAVRRYRQRGETPEQRFRMRLTIGCDAIAVVGIAWQLFPILLVPLCG